MSRESALVIEAFFHTMRAARKRRHIDGEDRLIQACFARVKRQLADRAELAHIELQAARDAWERAAE